MRTKIHYQWQKDWPQLPAGLKLGNPTGMGIDSAGHLLVFHRASKKWPLIGSFSKDLIADATILELDLQTGKPIKEWGKNIFIMPHGLTVDHQNNIWVTDVGLQQVLKFDHNGTLLMRIGEAKVAGNDETHFDQPTDVAIAKDGSFYVSDGYGNSRVAKFSPDGHFLFAWGTKGHQPGEFHLPHGIELDSANNVYVADRENRRIQVFDPNGHFLKEWEDESFGAIYAIRLDKATNQMIAVDYITNYLQKPKGSDILIFDLDGTLKSRFGRTSGYEGPICRYHDLAIDKEGNLYIGDILKNTIQKFKRVAD
jgi:peptidylamidoglycolate lyase